MGRYLPWIVFSILLGVFCAIFVAAQVQGKKSALLDTEKLKQYPAKVTGIVDVAPCESGPCYATKVILFDGSAGHATFFFGRMELDNGALAQPGDWVTVWAIPPTFFQAYQEREELESAQASTWAVWLFPVGMVLTLFLMAFVSP